MDMIKKGARGRGRGPRRADSARRQILSSAAVAPSRPRGAALFLTATAKGSAGDITQPLPVNKALGVAFLQASVRWLAAMPKSSWNFLHAFYLFERPGAVAEPLRGLREGLAPGKMVTKHLPSFLAAFLSGKFAPAEDISTALKKDEAGSPYTTVPCATVSCTDSNQRAAHRLREQCGPSSRRGAPRRRT